MWFNRFAEAVSVQVSRSWFFILTLAAVVAWIPTLWLLDPGTSDLIVDSIANPTSLVLLVLLHNAAFRSERASDARSDQLAEALAEVLHQLSREESDPDRRAYLEGRAERLVRVSREQHAFQTRGEARDGREGD